jgi:predicted anti-sigma-YlaC factor YlaD
MLTRHLLPDEFDLLLDGESGFGVSQLQGHLRDCPACREEFAMMRRFADALEELPELAPSRPLADRVMANVHVFVPWHVAARDWVAAWLPTHPALRIAAAGAATAVAGASTGALAWGWTQREQWIAQGWLAQDQLRSAAVEAASGAAGAVLGPIATAIPGGTGALVAATLGGLGLAIGAGVATLRVAAARARGMGA